MNSFIAFTDLTRKEAQDFIGSYQDQVKAVGGILDVHSYQSPAVLRLQLPDGVDAGIVPSVTWKQMRSQNVSSKPTLLD